MSIKYLTKGLNAIAVLILLVVMLSATFTSVNSASFEIVNRSDTTDSYFYVDGTSGNVGIGTDSPSSDLHLNVDYGLGHGIYISDARDSTNTRWQIRTDSNGDALLRGYDNTEVQTLQLFSRGISYFNGGSIGIGTKTPSQLLDVNGSINISDGSAKIYTPELCLNGDCQTSWPSGGDQSIWTNSSGNATIKNAKVGIGTTKPSTALYINGTDSSSSRITIDRISGNYGPSIELLEEGVQKWGFKIDSDGGNNNQLHIVNGTDDIAMVFLDNNYIGIGGSPSTKLHLQGDTSAGSTLTIERSSGNYGPAISFVEGGVEKWEIKQDSDGDNLDSLQFSNGTDVVFNLNKNGNVGIGTSTPLSTLHIIGDLNVSENISTSKLCLGGDCQTSWPSRESNYWTNDSNNLTYNLGNIGIGLGSDPSFRLEVKGNNLGLRSIANTNGVQLRLTESTSYENVDFSVRDGGNLYIEANNTGIGVTTPSEKLTVAGNINLTQDLLIGTGNLSDDSGTLRWNGVELGDVNGNGNIVCPSGFTKIQNNGYVLGCMQTDEEGSGICTNVADACFNAYGGRLPSYSEIRIAFDNYVLNDESDDNEWLENAGRDYTGGNPGCGYYQGSNGNPGMASISSSYAYRCFIPAQGAQGGTAGWNNNSKETWTTYDVNLTDGNLTIFNGNLQTDEICLNGQCETSWPSSGDQSMWTNSSGNATFILGNVGIGTSTPNYPLHINSSNSYAGIRLTSSDNLNTWLRFNNDLTFWSDNTSSSVLTLSEGNIGIGQGSPSQALDVNGAIQIGTTSVAEEGVIRYLNNKFEGYNGTNWLELNGQESGNLYAFHARMLGNKNIGTGTYVVDLNTTVFDSDGVFDTNTFSYNTTEAGYYILTGSVYLQNVADGKQFYADIYKVGEGVVSIGSLYAPGATGHHSADVSAVVYSDGDDVFQLRVYNADDDGTDETIYGSNGQYTYFSGAKLNSGSSLSGDSAWINNSGDIYYNSGNVGIGLSDPLSKLHVVGDIKATTNISTPELCLDGDCQTSWPSGGSGWDLNYSYLYNNSDKLDLNETKLNETIQALDTNTWWTLNNSYLYNNSGKLDLNETKLNATIQALSTDTDSTGGWTNTTTSTATSLDVNVSGNIIANGGYVNFGNVSGTNGFGFRDNSGSIEFKDNNGVWRDLSPQNTDGAVVWQKIWEYDVEGSATDEIIVTGLDGNSDEMYQIYASVIQSGSTGGYHYLTLNDDLGSNYGHQQIRGDQAVAGAAYSTSASYMQLLYTADSNDVTSFNGVLYAKSGKERLLEGSRITGVTGTDIQNKISWAYSWDNTADNIENITFASVETNAMGVGSHFEIWAPRPIAYQNVSVVCPNGFTKIQNNGYTLGCIQDDEQGSDTCMNAIDDCFDTYGGRLSTYNELLIAFSNYNLGSDETDDIEWVGGSISDNDGSASFECGILVGTDSFRPGSSEYTNSQAYRCFIPAQGAQGGSGWKNTSNDVFTNENVTVYGDWLNSTSKIYTPELCLDGDCQTSWPSGGDQNMWTNSSGNATFMNGYVGIGTTTPGAALEVHGNGQVDISHGVASIVDFIDGSPTDYDGRIRYEHANRKMQFYTSQTERMVIDSSGNVGIGISSPGAKLDVDAESGNLPVRITSSNSYNGLSIAMRYNSSSFRSWIGALDTGGFYVSGMDSGVNKHMVVSSSGSVGIGDTTPDGSLLLDVEGAIGASQLCDEDGNNCADVTSLTSGTSQWTTSGSDIYYSTGNVGIGIANPSAPLSIEGYGAESVYINSSYSTYGPGISLDATSQGGRKFGLINTGSGNPEGPNNLHIYDYTESKSIAIFEGDTGNVGIGTTTPNSTLHVDGSIMISNASSYLELSHDSNVSHIGAYADNGSAQDIYLWSNVSKAGDTPTMRFHSYQSDGGSRKRYADLYFDTWGNFIFGGDVSSFIFNEPFRMKNDEPIRFGNNYYSLGYDSGTGDLELTNSNDLDSGDMLMSIENNGAMTVSNGSNGITIDPDETTPTINTTNSQNLTITSSGGNVIIRLG